MRLSKRLETIIGMVSQWASHRGEEISVADVTLSWRILTQQGTLIWPQENPKTQEGMRISEQFSL